MNIRLEFEGLDVLVRMRNDDVMRTSQLFSIKNPAQGGGLDIRSIPRGPRPSRRSREARMRRVLLDSA